MEAYDDVIMGCANQAGEDNRNVARMSLLLAGLPFTVPGETVNRLCSSGLSAIIHANRAIKAAFGSFIGFLASATIKFLVSAVFLVYFLVITFRNWDALLA